MADPDGESVLFGHQYSQSHGHPTRDKPHECPICVFQALEIPAVPDAYNHAFSTNDPPHDTLLLSLRSSLAAFRSLSAEIEQHIAAMQSVKDACTVSIKKHESAVHPIRSVPNEILLAIFSWHIVSESNSTGRIHSSRPPWTLSQVSRRWRALTLSSPLLWSSINIRAYQKRDISFLCSRLPLVIERSGGCDLTVSIRGHSKIPWDESLRFLSQTTTRWRRLHISGHDAGLTLFLSGCSFERLTELVWSCYRHPASMTVLQNALDLRRVVIQGPENLHLKWDQITEYSCDTHGFRHLPELTALENLSLELTSTRGFPLVHIPSVRTLSLKATNRDTAVHRASQLLHFPSLTTLAIDSKVSLPLFPIPLPHLRNLRLDTAATPDDISAFLAIHVSVTSLYTANESVLRLLRVTVGQQVHLPNLTRLSIEAETLRRYTKTVVDVVESRCGDDGARLVALEVLGPEEEWRKAKDAVARVPEMLERWTTICGKIDIVENKEMVWRTGN